jgi:Xaa-Pro aminopeptidase
MGSSGERPNPFAVRQARLRALLGEKRIPALLITNPLNIYYLTAFRGSAGIAVFDADDARLWVDPRYTLQAREQAQGVKVIEEKRRLSGAAVSWLQKNVAMVAYEDSHLTCAALAQLKQAAGRKLRFKPSGGIVEELRLVKDSGEIDLMRQAGHLTAQVLRDVLHGLRPGLRECDLATDIEYRMRRAGAEGAAFETIVASGDRTALPHARASTKTIGAGELVIFDLGAILGGYASDITRTVYIGKPTRRARGLYEAALESQQNAISRVKQGAECAEIDAAARSSLKRYGLARYFTHSTGHGVGLEIHEKPRIGRGERTLLRAGNVVTVEPGIYIEGYGGIRIEDSVLVGAGEPEILTPLAKDEWLVG